MPEPPVFATHPFSGTFPRAVFSTGWNHVHWLVDLVREKPTRGENADRYRHAGRQLRPYITRKLAEGEVEWARS
jgi:hypothetical protein